MVVAHMLSAAIHEDRNQVLVPEEAVRAGVITPGDPVFWAYRPDERAAYVASRREVFVEARFRVVGQQTVTHEGVVMVPRLLFGGATAEEHPEAVDLFQFGQPIEWDVIEDQEMCRVRPK